MIVYSDPAQDKCRLQGTAKIAEDGPSADLVISLNLIIYPNRNKCTNLKTKQKEMQKIAHKKRSLSKLKDYKYPFKVNLSPSCDLHSQIFQLSLVFSFVDFCDSKIFSNRRVKTKRPMPSTWWLGKTEKECVWQAPCPVLRGMKIDFNNEIWLYLLKPNVL